MHSGGAAAHSERGVEWGRRALVVGPDGALRRQLTRELGRLGMDIVSRSTPTEALAEARRLEPPVVIACAHGDAQEAVVLLSRLHDELPRVQRILVVDKAAAEALASQTAHARAPLVLVLPVSALALTWSVRNCVEQHGMLEENARLRDLLERQGAALRELNADVHVVVERTQERLVRSKRLWERTFDALNEPLAVIDAEGVVRMANRAYAAASGRPMASVAGAQCHDVHFGRSAPCVACPLSAGGLAGVHEERRVEVPGRAAGEVFSLSIFPIVDDDEPPEGRRFLCAYRDVSRERALLRTMTRVERTAAVGELAAGVAHELNNPLAGILGLAQALLRDQTLQNDDAAAVADIEEAALRCKRIIEALTLFARGPRDASDERIDIAATIESALVIIRASLREAGVAHEVMIEPGLPPVRGSSALVQQALVALLKNAAEALRDAPPLDDGKRRVSIRALRHARGVWIEVADNGPGVAEGQRSQLFTPFVTGRNTVEGAGFGLATVSRIAESLGGSVEHIDGPERGATFRLTLPADATAPPLTPRIADVKGKEELQ